MAVEPQLDEIHPGLFGGPADRFPDCLEHRAGFHHLESGVKRLHTHLVDVSERTRRLGAQVDGELRRGEVPAVIGVELRDHKITRLERSPGRHRGLLGPVNEMPDLTPGVLHRAGSEQVEDDRLRAVDDLGLDQFGIEFRLRHPRARDPDHRVHRLASDLAGLGQHGDLLLALDHAELFEEPAGLDQRGVR